MIEQHQMTTPENVSISYDLAGVGSRFVASFVDNLILIVIELGLFAVSFLVAQTGNFFPSNSGLGEFLTMAASMTTLILSFVLLLGYGLIFEMAWSGQTPGKRMAGIRVVRNDGSPITAIAAVIRNVMRIVDFLPAYYIIGVVVMLIDKKIRRLGDLAAGTICIKERRDVKVTNLNLLSDVSGNSRPAMESEFINLGRLSYNDYYLVKEYLLRSDSLQPKAAQKLAVQIAELISAKLEVERKGEPAKDFLYRVGKALERRNWR